jgi:transcriptional regulator with XRE-family HTH domain
MKRTEPRNPEQMDHLRNNLRTLMEERQLSPGELASKAIIPLSSLLRILDKTIKNPGLDVTQSLARALDVTVSELIGDSVMQPGNATIYVEANDREYLLLNIIRVFTNNGLNITSSISTGNWGRARLVFQFHADQDTNYEKMAKELRAITGITWFRISTHTDHEINERRAPVKLYAR